MQSTVPCDPPSWQLYWRQVFCGQVYWRYMMCRFVRNIEFCNQHKLQHLNLKLTLKIVFNQYVMLGNFFLRSTGHKHCVNTKETFLACVHRNQNVATDSPVSIGGQGKYMQCVSFIWPPLHAAMSALNILLFVLKTFFSEFGNKNKGICHVCRIISFLKMSVFKRSVLYFS